MKYVCDACERLVEPSGCSDGEPISLICSRCGELSPIGPLARDERAAPKVDAAAGGSPEASPVSAPPTLPDERCPKCTHPRSGDACPKCGLVFALYKPEVGSELSRATEELSKLLSVGPAEAAKRLGNLGPEQLMRLARACRLRLAEAPADARAQALLEEISSRSLAQVMALAPAVRAQEAFSERGRLVVYAAVGVGILALGGLAAYLMAQLSI